MRILLTSRNFRRKEFMEKVTFRRYLSFALCLFKNNIHASNVIVYKKEYRYFVLDFHWHATELHKQILQEYFQVKFP